jgi:DNA polymerase III alpha subunit
MAIELFKLDDRSILDTGEVVLSYPALLSLARDGLPFNGALTYPDERIEKYNTIAEKPLMSFEDDGEFEGPYTTTLEWNIPSEFEELDVLEFCLLALDDRGLATEEYVQRLDNEIKEFEARGLIPFLKNLISLVLSWKEKGVVWGVGRGSSCASLVLFLIDLNMVDPVKYEIELEEFFR